MTGIISWGINCGKKDVPGVYASVQKALCFIDFATKCKHGKKYTDFYDYEEHCNSWVEDTIDDLRRKRNRGKYIRNLKALNDSCIAEPVIKVVPKATVPKSDPRG